MKYIGNTGTIIDWQSVVDSLSNQTPGYVGPRHSGNDDIVGISDVAKKWDQAGFLLIKDGGNAGWDMFFPHANFDQTIVDTFADYVNVDPISCWISRVQPGCLTPWHWDANDNEKEYSTIKNMVRMSCNISKPQVGHVIMVENECLYFQEQGSVWQWPDRTSWHGGINCGMTPKYLFNFFGVRR
jgi:hypothetical protein